MTRLQDNPYLPTNWEEAHRQLDRLYRNTAQQLNQLSEGYVQAATNAATAAPTTGTYSVGDVVRNSTPTELGVAASKYVIMGWVCVSSGTPGTFLQLRALTGN